MLFNQLPQLVQFVRCLACRHPCIEGARSNGLDGPNQGLQGAQRAARQGRAARQAERDRWQQHQREDRTEAREDIGTVFRHFADVQHHPISEA